MTEHNEISSLNVLKQDKSKTFFHAYIYFQLLESVENGFLNINNLKQKMMGTRSLFKTLFVYKRKELLKIVITVSQ